MQSIIEKAQKHEELGEYKQAIVFYLKLTPKMFKGDSKTLGKYWTHGGKLAVTHLKRSQAEYVVQTAAPLLMGIGMYLDAANLYNSLGLKELAVGTLIAGKLWNEAKDLAGEVSPDMERYVQDQQMILVKEVEALV